jgi:hypothetical protein
MQQNNKTTPTVNSGIQNPNVSETKGLELYNDDNHKVFGDITIADIKQASIYANQKEILLAHFTEKSIRNIDSNYAGLKITQLINRTIFESGFNAEKINIPELIVLVVQDIFSDFSHLTVSEISTAFRKGIRGDYGEFYGISVRSFYVWLKGYQERLQEALEALTRINKPENDIVSDEKKKLYHKEWLKSHIADFESYKSGEEIVIHDYGHVLYNYCKKHGIGYLSEQEKDDLFDRGKDLVLKNHSKEMAKSSVQLMEFRDVVSAIVSGDINTTIRNKIIAEAKRLAIMKIYDKLIQENINLKDLIVVIEGEDF